MRAPAFLVIGLLAAGLLPISSGFAQENDYQIVPTQRVGKWGLSKPVDAYGLGQPTDRWEGKSPDGRPYSDVYAFLVSQAGPVLHLHACKSDGLTFAIYAIRRVNLAPDAQPEALKYKTAHGIGIGSDVGEITRALGNPRNIGGWTERHGQIEVSVAAYNYMGLNILVNKADNKVFGIGVSTEGAWGACQQAVLGRPAAAQAPAPVNPLFQETDYRIVPGQRTGKIDLGRPIDAYGLGRPYGQWEGEASRIPYYDTYHYSLRVPDGRLQIQISTCRYDGLVFAVLLWRGIDAPVGAEMEALKYKTVEGVGIGTDEGEVFRLLGRPEGTGKWTERHGTIEVSVSDHYYRGLRVRVSDRDRKVYAIGATTTGGWTMCRRKVLGSFNEPSPLFSVSGPSGVLIPRNTMVVPPGPEVPREQAAFSGKWSGRWPGDLPHVLVVEEIRVSPPRVIVVYANGGSQPIWVRWAGVLSGREIRLDRDRFGPNTASVSYRLLADDAMDGFLALPAFVWVDPAPPGSKVPEPAGPGWLAFSRDQGGQGPRSEPEALFLTAAGAGKTIFVGWQARRFFDRQASLTAYVCSPFTHTIPGRAGFFESSRARLQRVKE